MAAQKGSAMLMKVGNGGSPETFTTIAGLRSTSLTINNESVDVTNKDSSGKRTMLAAAGVQSISVSGSGVFTDAASETTVKTNALADTQDNYQFLVPDFGTFTGAFQITSLEYAGEFNGEVTYSISFESAGAITFATEVKGSKGNISAMLNGDMLEVPNELGKNPTTVIVDGKTYNILSCVLDERDNILKIQLATASTKKEKSDDKPTKGRD